ncbi:Protein MAIN-LIKE 1 [Glycine max]|nr:Protein MAIN-LIKE 1 [Glycine max]
MIRTRGLRETLGRIIGRALVSGDADETPQRRRPIASALAPVAEDVKHVDHAADKPEEAVTDDVAADAQERIELKSSSNGRKVEKFGRPAPKIEGIVAATRLSPLIACSLDTGDRGLIYAFVERWHKETSSFHLPVEEVTITLDDVALPTFDALHVDQVVDLLVDLLEVSSQEARDETFQCHGHMFGYPGCETFIVANVAHSLLASSIHVHVVFLDAFRDLSQTESYSWGAVALVYMYENLNDKSKRTARQLVGYITFLQIIMRGNHMLAIGSLGRHYQCRRIVSGWID